MNVSEGDVHDDDCSAPLLQQSLPKRVRDLEKNQTRKVRDRRRRAPRRCPGCCVFMLAILAVLVFAVIGCLLAYWYE